MCFVCMSVSTKREMRQAGVCICDGRQRSVLFFVFVTKKKQPQDKYYSHFCQLAKKIKDEEKICAGMCEMLFVLELENKRNYLSNSK